MSRNAIHSWFACLAVSGFLLADSHRACALERIPESALDLSWLMLEPFPDDAAKVDTSGRFVVYLDSADSPAGRDERALWSLPEEEGRALLVSPKLPAGYRIREFALSPDGRWIAYTSSQGDGPRRLELVPSHGGAARVVDTAGDVARFAFDPASRVLAFSSATGRAAAVFVLEEIFSEDFEGGNTSNWSDTTANACPAATGGPTLHANSVLSSTTWTANGSPHVLTGNVLVPPGITLTIAPCAEVRVRPGFELAVEGTLVARGTPFQRIAFRRDNPALPWDSIWVSSPGFANLAFLDLSGGGAAGASVIVEGVDTLPAVRPLVADHLKISGSTSYGIKLYRRAGFHSSSRDLVISGSGATDATAPFPVRMSLNTVMTLPVGIYTGNASDRIQVIGENGSAVEVDETFHDRGVPYQVGGPAGAFGILVVDGDPALATLTIEPGVEIGFYTSGSNIGGLFVGTSGSPVATGRLVAAGTATRPIRFTGSGAAPVAGSWEGITFFGAMASGNVLDHVVIDAAGDNGGDANFGCPPPAFPETSGALKIFEQPTSEFLTNSTISRSSTHGVFRAWIGGQVDFLATNSFQEVAFCKQVLPKPPLPAVCPANPECP